MKREFFSVKTVAEAREGFCPARRTPSEEIPLERGLGRVLASAIVSPHDLPGFARSAVDGYAVRASDTFGASSTLPAALRVAGSVAMGAAPSVTVGPGIAASISTGGALPDGANAVVMVERTTPAAGGSVEVLEAVAPGEAVVRADEDVSAGAELVAAGQRLRAEHLGLLSAAGLNSLRVFARARVAIVATGDELVPAGTQDLAPGQIRDSISSAVAALVRGAGGSPLQRGIVPDDPSLLRAELEAAMAESDIVVVSAGSSVGARDLTAEVVAGLGEPGIWCHGLALKPGKPTLLAECNGVPLIGLPGNPASALVVFRLLGVPLVRLIGGETGTRSTPSTQAMLVRDVPSAPGRLDVIQVRLTDAGAEPIFAKSSALSALAWADGHIMVPEEAGGLYAGSDVTVELHTWALDG